MEGPSTVSSDILGIEIGRDVVRGILLDNDTSNVIAAAESAIICDRRFRPDGIVSTKSVGPAINDLLYRLRIDHNARVRTGITIGPKHSGVGSGPALPQWLDEQAQWLEEAMLFSGSVGVSFAPARAVHAVIALCRQVGLEPTRIDLAAVAAARLLGEEVEDAITLGSGRGWRARLRDFEVLEAIELADMPADEPLRVIRRDGLSGPITKYHKADVPDELFAQQRIDLGQLAPAVGAAVGVLHGSSGNLLLGQSINYRKKTTATVPVVPAAAATAEAAAPTPQAAASATTSAAATSAATSAESAAAQTGVTVDGSSTDLTPEELAAAFRMPAHGVDPAYHFDGRTDTTELRITTRLSPLNNPELHASTLANGNGNGNGNGSSNGNGSGSSNGNGVHPAPEHNGAAAAASAPYRESEPSESALAAYPAPEPRGDDRGLGSMPSPVGGTHGEAAAPAAAATAVDVVEPEQPERHGDEAVEHDQELIDMFKPDPEAEQQIRKAAGGRSFGLVLGVLVVIALALAVAYLYL